MQAAIFHKDAVHFTKGQNDLIFYNPQYVLLIRSSDIRAPNRPTVPSDKATEYKLPLKMSCARCHVPIADEGRNMMLMLPGLIEFDYNLLPGMFRCPFSFFTDCFGPDMDARLTSCILQAPSARTYHIPSTSSCRTLC